MKLLPLPVDWELKLGAVPAGSQVPLCVRSVGAIPATVPGCVHTDLLAAGLIEDPYVGLNEAATHWIGGCGWHYQTSFEVPADTLEEDRIDLVFEGMDTVAEVELNGRVIGEAENMHVRHRFDAKAALRKGSNTLTVRFDSPIAYAQAMQERIGARPVALCGTNEQLPHHMIRKMACNFGWDWGPQLVTCGIWRPVHLEAWSTARVQDVRPLVKQATADVAVVEVYVDGDSAQQTGDVSVRCTLTQPGGGVVATEQQPWVLDSGTASEPVRLTVDQPRRWWPIGYGDQPLYELCVELLGVDGAVLDGRLQRIGLREVQLVIEPDATPGTVGGVEGLGQGESFAIHVNGQRVFCKGANWIPDDCFPHRVTPDRYRRRIDQSINANMNMLRVWGGGIYEDHAFYDYCDEQGVLVWQDFCLACACYAEEEPMWSQIEAEARDNVARLSRHSSLVLWNGCNENFWAVFDWPAFKGVYPGGDLTWGRGYYLELFPKVLAELDPSRPYWPGSPYSGSMGRHPNANEYGNRHIWDVWNDNGNYRNYLGHSPRFASEFGYMGPPNWATVRRAIPEDQQQWLSETSIHHNKQGQGQERGLERIADWFDVPEAYEDQWFLASIGQARALTMGCEWFRALSPWCSGALYWQLNDCWPVTSWSAIDGDGRPKLMWYATRQFFRPRLLTIMPTAVTPAGEKIGALAAYLHNDHDGAWRGELRVQRLDVTGRVLETFSLHVDVEPRGSARVPLPFSQPGVNNEVLVASMEGSPEQDRAWWFYGVDREIHYPAPSLRHTLENAPDGSQQLTVTSDTVVRELCLLVDRLAPEATVDRQLVNLLPGESVTFTIRSDRPLRLAQLTAPDVLRSVNAVASPVPNPSLVSS